MEKIRCQSCGQPLGVFKDAKGQDVNNFGSEADGSRSEIYCNFCYDKGEFTMPGIKLQDMIELSVKNMTEDLGFSKDDAYKNANEILPTLKRWISAV